jgi:hypothetical protein
MAINRMFLKFQKFEIEVWRCRPFVQPDDLFVRTGGLHFRKFINESRTMNMIELLTETRDETEKYFDLPQGVLKKTYAKGKWTIREILVHLADAESVLHERIKRIIAEPRQVLWAFRPRPLVQ